MNANEHLSHWAATVPTRHSRRAKPHCMEILHLRFRMTSYYNLIDRTLISLPLANVVSNDIDRLKIFDGYIFGGDRYRKLFLDEID